MERKKHQIAYNNNRFIFLQLFNIIVNYPFLYFSVMDRKYPFKLS